MPWQSRGAAAPPRYQPPQQPLHFCSDGVPTPTSESVQPPCHCSMPTYTEALGLSIEAWPELRTAQSKSTSALVHRSPSSSILAIHAACGNVRSAYWYHACTLCGLCHFWQSLVGTKTTSPWSSASLRSMFRAHGTSPATQRVVAYLLASGSHEARAATRSTRLLGTTMIPSAMADGSAAMLASLTDGERGRPSSR